jgi:hypothetical protein
MKKASGLLTLKVRKLQILKLLLITTLFLVIAYYYQLITNVFIGSIRFNAAESSPGDISVIEKLSFLGILSFVYSFVTYLITFFIMLSSITMIKIKSVFFISSIPASVIFLYLIIGYSNSLFLH